MLKKYFLVLLLTLISSLAIDIQAQDNSSSSLFDPDIIYQIELIDGSIFVGNIIKNENHLLTFVTLSDIEMKVPMKKVHGIVKYNPGNPIQYQSNEISIDNTSDRAYDPTSYLVSGSAFTLKEGESYYKNHYLFINSFTHGITDYFQITGGFEVLSIFTSIAGGYEGGPVTFGTAKIGTSVTEKIHISGNASFLAILGEIDSGGLGATIGTTATFGDIYNQFSLGMNMAIIEDTEPSPMFTIAGMFKISDNVAFITENWIIVGDDDSLVNLSGGFRFHGSKTYFDLALVSNQYIVQTFFAIPVLSAGVKF